MWGETGGSTTFNSSSIRDAGSDEITPVLPKLPGSTDSSVTLTKRLRSLDALNRQTKLWQRRKAAYGRSRKPVDATLTMTYFGGSRDYLLLRAYVSKVVTARLATNPTVYTLKLTLGCEKLVLQR
jgi:hypothetical protein